MQTAQPPTASVYPDRSARLRFLGTFQVVLGGLWGMMTALAALSALMLVLGLLGSSSKSAQSQAIDIQELIQGIVLFAPMAVGAIWLGIGLYRARRWAWTLSVAWSWMWLITGVFSLTTFVLFRGPPTQHEKMSPQAIVTMRLFSSVFEVCYDILLPGLFLVLCHREAVRATCQRQDPKTPWTDRCPMPVLALSTFLAWTIVWVVSLLAYRCAIPLFGVVFSGAAGAGVILLIALMQADLAWGIYRLQRVTWWGTLLFGIVGISNIVVTFSQTNLMNWYEKMALPDEQLEMFRKSGIAESMTHWGPWISLVGGAAWLGYLLYVRRYFVRHGDRTRATSPAHG
jgi:hypothetical protein